MIPNIREAKISVYRFQDNPVKSIIFTGKRYQAAHQKVVMSEVGGGLKREKNYFKSTKSTLNERKVSMVESGGLDYGPASAFSHSTLYLAGGFESGDEDSYPSVSFQDDDSRDRSEAICRNSTIISESQENLDMHKDSLRNTESFATDDGIRMAQAFPMLTAQQEKSVSSSLIMPTYVMVLGENLQHGSDSVVSSRGSSMSESPNLSIRSVRKNKKEFSMLTFQVV